MKDIMGKELAIGDRVAFNPPTYKGLALAMITGFTPKMVKLSFRYNREDCHTVAFPRDVAKVES